MDQFAEFVEILGRARNEGFRTPRIGAVSNSANGVFTMLNCLTPSIGRKNEGREISSYVPTDGDDGRKWEGRKGFLMA